MTMTNETAPEGFNLDLEKSAEGGIIARGDVLGVELDADLPVIGVSGDAAAGDDDAVDDHEDSAEVPADV